jgi:hypothetical protein
MAIKTSWKIEIGTLNPAPIDFTSRTLGVSIDQQVDVNVIGRGVATITLLNKDGALTPGGGGTYSSTDWFSNFVRITALTNTGGANDSTIVFCGLVDDFELSDDGVFSTVTLHAIDGLAVAGKTANVSISGTLARYEDKVDGLAVSNDMPVLGASTAAFIPTYEGPTVYVSSASTITASTYADAWQTNLIPSVNDVFWGTTIGLLFGVFAEYDAVSLGLYTTRRLDKRHTFEFDPPASLSGSKLPFDEAGFEQAFNHDELITKAQVQGTYAGAAAVTVNASTLTKYGTRTSSYTQTMAVDDAAVTDLAQRLANRYSTARFTPYQLRVSASQIKAFAADAAHSKWKALLSIESGIWQHTKITWKGSGSSTQTAECVVKGRKIDVTPSDSTITLTLGNWVDNHGFILDTDTLDNYRLG